MVRSFNTPFRPARSDVDDYEVKQLLGKGGFATVHQRGQAEGLDVAMKVIGLEHYLKSSGLSLDVMKKRHKRFKKLCGVNAQDRHPNLYVAFETRFSPTEMYLFLELCQGGDLFSRIITNPNECISEGESREVARALCGAVAHIHARGWIHRDIKPENIFFRSQGSAFSECLLGDFGCAIDEVKPGYQYYDSAGSAGYSSPEMVAGRGYGFKTDEFSIGITIYECLTGRSPYVGEGSAALNHEVLHRAVPYPRRYWGHLSKEARDFVSRLLEKDPRKRMSVEEALDHPWICSRWLRSFNSDESDASWTSPVTKRTTSRLATRASRVASRKSTHSFAVGMDELAVSMKGVRIYTTHDVIRGEIPAGRISQIAQQHWEPDQISSSDSCASDSSADSIRR